MTAAVLNGKQIALEIRERIKADVAKLSEQGVRPGLAVILVGDDPASHVYVNNKAKACGELGLYSEVHRLPASTTETELLELVDQLNKDTRIHGILVQLPLPAHIREKAVIDAIHPEKDVDGFHPVSAGNLMIGDTGFVPCTPAGIMELIRASGICLSGKHAVVIGRSNIVGKPVAMLLLRENATVTICHSRTENLQEIARQADVLVVAIGKAKQIDRRYVKPGAVVIDVGVNRLENGKLAGDVDYDDVEKTAGYITPVPGGVGPMTITMLMMNTLISARRAAGLE